MRESCSITFKLFFSTILLNRLANKQKYKYRQKMQWIILADNSKYFSFQYFISVRCYELMIRNFLLSDWGWRGIGGCRGHQRLDLFLLYTCSVSAVQLLNTVHKHEDVHFFTSIFFDCLWNGSESELFFTEGINKINNGRK